MMAISSALKVRAHTCGPILKQIANYKSSGVFVLKSNIKLEAKGEKMKLSQSIQSHHRKAHVQSITNSQGSKKKFSISSTITANSKNTHDTTKNSCSNIFNNAKRSEQYAKNTITNDRKIDNHKYHSNDKKKVNDSNGIRNRNTDIDSNR